ncbi:probable Rho GTPase-activating protein CG5521 isoform X2 [Toxorhynchites rutilus septentrionalis]|uniref:probable Rho GTPase-activating protein CG5521 isoform X2 n=1 Tax=Toxorhynchites rutilus septentrionalis TaxID=329112 RepID=UPI002479B9BE|nr:probable Rho GTPase-activating protein CG5521 isoform X2 [Toxorhynchites rutilus septentrionalis]
MFTKKSNIDVKKSTAKIQDSKKDSTARLRHLKTILDHVDSEEAKNIFETNYSHVYYILYDTFVQAEANLRQRVHKTHREELDGSLWLLNKILCLLPELIARRWQVHSLGRILAKLLHYGNSVKLRKEGVRYFLLWYQALGDNAPPFVHGMFTELVPGMTIPQKGKIGPLSSDSEFIATDVLNHPNMKGELGGSVFHDTGAHPVKSPEIQPLIPPSSNERTAAPDPRDGLEILLDCMVQSCGCIKWRDNTPQKHIRTLNFLLGKFREQYLPVFCPNFDYSTSIYDPKLDLPAMRHISKREEVMSSCIVVLVIWIAKYTHERHISTKLDNVQIDEEVVGENASLLSNLRHMGYTQTQLVRDVLYSSRDTINFVHEIYRQAFLMSFTSKSQIEAMRIAISVYRDWMSTIPPPPFLLEPDTSDSSLSGSSGELQPHSGGGRPANQRLRTDSYLGAISKENVIIRAGLQNVLQVFVTNAVNVFMVNTAHLNIHFQSKTNSDGFATPLDEQTDICKRVLNIYRTMVMKTRMEAKTWEQLLLVLLQVTSVILQNSPPNAKKNNLGGRLAQPIFQTLIVTWIRAHTNVVVNPGLWDKFLKVLSSLTHREELIVEWDKTMQTLTRVLARQVYNINLSDLPLDRLAEQKGKRKRGTPSNWTQSSTTSDRPDNSAVQCNSNGKPMIEETGGEEIRLQGHGNALRSIPGTPSLNRSYSEGSLAPFRKSRTRRRVRNKQQNSNQQHVAALPMMVEHSLNRMLSNTSGGGLSISNEHLDVSRFSQCDESIVIGPPTIRRALSLDSIRPPPGKNRSVGNDSDSYRCGSRSPSPTASSGIESGSIKDSPMQIDVLTADSSSIDTQDENSAVSADRRSILAGGTARGWLPDVAAIMWRRMLGALGDVNKILNPKLHAQVFQYLVNITESLIKIRMNQGISLDGQPIPLPSNLVPPIALVAPWCYGALTLDGQYSQGKLYAMQLLCTIVKSGASLVNNQFPLFYHALHQALSGEDRAMAYTALRYLEGPRFLSLLLPGHTLLLLDFVHACTIVLTSSETGPHAPRAQVAGLLGSLLCFPKTSLPGPVLQPSEPNIELMECPDLQEHVLNVVLRCARREPTAKARCIAIASLGQWILQNLTNPSTPQVSTGTDSNFKQRIPQVHPNATAGRDDFIVNMRVREAFQVILQALQFKHRTIARLASETLKLCAEQGRRIERIDRLPELIIDTLCLSLEIQNVPHPKDSDKTVLTSLLLTLGEFCMSFSVDTLQRPKGSDTDESLVHVVFKVLYKIAMGVHNGERIKLFTTDEDFDMTITLDDVREQNATTEPTYQTPESIASCQSAIRLCAKTVAMHLITNLGHFPMGIGATRLSSLVDEHDDLTTGGSNTMQRDNSMGNRDSLDLGATQVLNSPNLQLLMLSSELVASFIELPALKLPGGGATAGLATANRQVRLLLRDLNGKACWDASILYKEPNTIGGDASRLKDYYSNGDKQSSTFQFRPGGGSSRIFPGAVTSIDPMMSTIGLPIAPLRHTLRHRPVHQLPVAKDLAPDLDQLDDLLQYIGYTSPECLDTNGCPLNTAGPSPLGPSLEAQTISIILNQRAIEMEYVARQNAAIGQLGESPAYSFGGSVGYTSFIDDCAIPTTMGPSGTLTTKPNTSVVIDRNMFTVNAPTETKPFQFGRILFNQLGLAGWERRKRTHLLQRTDKLLRELRNLDNQKCRETHKMAVIYVANGQEDKGTILKNSCGSSTYEMFVSALGWEVELESHNGFLGGLPRQGCGQTAPYYATPFLEVIYHVSTRMPSDSPEAILNKTRHLGNDEVHIVWSEHNRDYRRDILPTEFCDVLIVIYPLKSGLFRVTVNKKPDVPWFGPLSDEVVVGGSCLASLVRASAINASRAKRTSLSLYQQYYEERNRSMDTVATRHKENSTLEDFIARIFSPIPPQGTVSGGTVGVIGGSSGTTVATSGVNAPLAAALIDHHRTSSKTWIHHPEIVATAREVTQQTAMASVTLDQPSPRPLRKLHHPFKPGITKPPKPMPTTSSAGGASTLTSHHQFASGTTVSTPPDSPTLPGRTKFK